jgi:hypothetical protein
VSIIKNLKANIKKLNENIHVIQGPQSSLQLVLNGGRAEKKRNIFNLWQFSTFLKMGSP